VITEAIKSKEHIPPRCIGGRLKPKTLLCRACNNEFTAIDRELCDHLKFITNRLNVKRDSKRRIPKVKGRLPNTNVTVFFEPGRKRVTAETHVQEVDANGSRVFLITAATREEVQRITNALEQSHPGMKGGNIKEHKITQVETETNILGTEKEFRSVCKIAANYYLSVGGEPSLIGPAIRYIREGVGSKRVWFHYSDTANTTLSKQAYGPIFHRISLIGDCKDRLLYGYVELYTAFKYLVLLNDHYCGNNVNLSYYLDVLNHKKNVGKAVLNFSRDQLLKMKQEYSPPTEIAGMQILSLLDAIYLRLGYEDTEQPLEEYIEHAFERWSDRLLTVYGRDFLEHGLTLVDFAKGFDIGFLYEIEDLIYPTWLNCVTTDSETQFYRFLDRAVKEAASLTLQRHQAGTPINRDLLLAFVVGLFAQMLGWMDSRAKEAIGAFVNRHNLPATT
jgi:hypothetical protein